MCSYENRVHLQHCLWSCMLSSGRERSYQQLMVKCLSEFGEKAWSQQKANIAAKQGKIIYMNLLGTDKIPDIAVVGDFNLLEVSQGRMQGSLKAFGSHWWPFLIQKVMINRISEFRLIRSTLIVKGRPGKLFHKRIIYWQIVSRKLVH